ncbi:MAG TPA: hypothetical protein VJ798_13010 [Rhizomicrobium sp.]|nr:hypothetical protein [Rhizomicrobium sp.]
MPVADIIEEKFKSHPEARYSRDGSSITVQSKEAHGFPVSYSFNDGRHAVSYLGWHEEFEDQDEALDCFAFGLSKKCRLQVWKKGHFPYKWVVEVKDSEGNWKEDSRTGLLLFPYWKGTTITSLQNDLMK